MNGQDQSSASKKCGTTRQPVGDKMAGCANDLGKIHALSLSGLVQLSSRDGTSPSTKAVRRPEAAREL